MGLARHRDGRRCLALVTYGYFAGRVLAPLFALGLLFFATRKHRVVDVFKIWLAYGLTLVPLVLFNRSHPGVITKRLSEVSYIKPGVPLEGNRIRVCQTLPGRSELDPFAHDGRLPPAPSRARLGRSDIFCHLYSGNDRYMANHCLLLA